MDDEDKKFAEEVGLAAAIALESSPFIVVDTTVDAVILALSGSQWAVVGLADDADDYAKACAIVDALGSSPWAVQVPEIAEAGESDDQVVSREPIPDNAYFDPATGKFYALDGDDFVPLGDQFDWDWTWRAAEFPTKDLSSG